MNSPATSGAYQLAAVLQSTTGRLLTALELAAHVLHVAADGLREDQAHGHAEVLEVFAAGLVRHAEGVEAELLEDGRDDFNEGGDLEVAGAESFPSLEEGLAYGYAHYLDHVRRKRSAADELFGDLVDNVRRYPAEGLVARADLTPAQVAEAARDAYLALAGRRGVLREKNQPALNNRGRPGV